MTIERALRAIAGAFILASLALGWFVSPWFYAFTAFVGLNLLQSGFTNACPMMGRPAASAAGRLPHWATVGE